MLESNPPQPSLRDSGQCVRKPNAEALGYCRKRVKLEIGTGAVRAVGSSLLATKKVEWLTAIRVVRRRGVLYLVAAPGLVPRNLPEIFNHAPR